MGDGFESFEITDDDYQQAFDPTSRKRRKFTKEDAVYGMWAENDSDEEDSRRGFGGGGGKKQADYSAPMSFVSGGLKEGDKGKNREHNEPGDDDVTIISSTKAKPSNRGPRKTNTFAGVRAERDKDFAKFEAHTKGIGMKLLEKFGFKPGQGLGKEGTGIAKPIEVQVRKGKGAIGAYGSERLGGERVYEEEDFEEGSKRVTIKHKKQWKKKDGASAPSYQFRTVEEVLQEKDEKVAGGWDTSELSKVKVIDMTGKETRVLSGYHAMHTNRIEHEDDGETPRVFDVAELRHNLDLLIDMSEARIVESNKKLEYEKNLAVTLEEEKKVLTVDIQRDDEQVDRLNYVMEKIDELVLHQEAITLGACLRTFEELLEEYLTEYRFYELEQLAAGIVCPILGRYLSTWDPLRDPEFGHAELSLWRPLLEPPQRSFEATRNTSNSFHTVLWEVWMPFVRSAAMRWQPKVYVETRQTDPMERLISTWEDVLPQWMVDNILEQLILPRLVAQTEEWDPTVDVVPIHQWIHPWLPFLKDRLDILYGTIRSKLASALTQWHPSDQSARLMINPWIGVFSQATLEQFLIRSILPKLQEAIENMEINPRRQQLEPWHWTMSWVDIVPLSSMAALLERSFFPRWLRVLDAWLKADPNMEEIPEWYTGWKNLVPDVLKSHPTVQEQLSTALYAMSSATGEEDELPPRPPPGPPPGFLAGPPPPSLNPRMAPPPPLNPRMAPPPPPPGLSSVSMGYTSSAPTFKDVIERRANDLGILFVPVQGRNFQGKQVFRFGSNYVSFERNVIFVQQSFDSWQPIALEELLRIAAR